MIAVLFFMGCEKNLKLEQYNGYLANPQNGLVKDFTRNNLHIVCAYKPKESFGETAAAGMDEKNVYCTLSFSINGQEVENAFLRDERVHNECINYLTSYVYTDVSLCTAKDTLPATASLYARQYGGAKASAVLVVFATNKTDLSHGFDILYRGDKFGVGPVRFSFSAVAVNHLPALHY